MTKIYFIFNNKQFISSHLEIILCSEYTRKSGGEYYPMCSQLDSKMSDGGLLELLKQGCDTQNLVKHLLGTDDTQDSLRDDVRPLVAQNDVKYSCCLMT